VFQHDDGVGALRYRGSRHNLDSLAGLNLSIEGVAGASLADHGQASGQVGGAHGKSIAHGAVEGGIIAVGAERCAEHSPAGFRQVDEFNVGDASGVLNLVDYQGAGLGETEWRH
jgi:hypothetical protein